MDRSQQYLYIEQRNDNVIQEDDREYISDTNT